MVFDIQYTDDKGKQNSRRFFNVIETGKKVKEDDLVDCYVYYFTIWILGRASKKTKFYGHVRKRLDPTPPRFYGHFRKSRCFLGGKVRGGGHEKKFLFI